LLTAGEAAPKKGVSLDDLKPRKAPVAAPRPPVAKKPAPRPGPRKPPVPARAVRSQPVKPAPAVTRQPAAAKPVTLLVSQSGGGQFKTLGEALRLAPAGARILVRGGVYRESLVLERSVEVMPSEPGDQVVLESPAGPCLTLQAGQALVRGLSLRVKDGVDGVDYTVVITQGKAVLEGCEIGAGDTGCVRIAGAQAAPVLRRCAIRKGSEQGVLLEGRAHATFEDCPLSGGGLGMLVSEGSEATLRNCQLFENENGGIQFTGQSRGTLQGCELRANGGTAVEILEGSSPILRKTRVHHGAQGIGVAGKSQPLIEDCDVFSNSLTGVWVSGGSQPILRQSRIYDQKRSGLSFVAQAGGTVMDTEVRGSIDAPCVTVRDGSTPRFQHCTIRAARKRGLEIDSAAAPVLEDCEIRDNGDFNVHVSRDGKPVLRNCKIHHAGGASVVIETGARASLYGCSIYGSTEGVYVWGKAEPTLTQCRIYDNHKEGLKFEVDGLGTFEDCDIYDNGEAGVWMVNEANPIFRRCRIVDGRSVGVYVGPRGRGTFEQCQIARNRVANVNSVEAGRPVLRACQVE
jgi:F-box protein 11